MRGGRVKNANILIVDGRIDLMEPLKEIFERKGYNVTMVEEEDRAIRLLKRKNFDVLLTPRQIPGQRGAWDFEAIKRLYPSMAVVIVNSAGEKKEMFEMGEAKIEAVVDKPFNVQKLVDTIEFILEVPSVLIVNHRIRDWEALRDMLAERRCRALVAENRDETIDMVRENNFDVVLLDVRVPEVRSIEILETIKKIKPGIEVIMMIDYSSVSLVGDLLRGGAYTCLYKPFLDIEKLVKVVQEVKSQKRTYPALTEMESLPR